MNELERENARLKTLVADLSLETGILKEVAEGNLIAVRLPDHWSGLTHFD